jgi:hypothetical protein
MCFVLVVLVVYPVKGGIPQQPHRSLQKGE